jgi:hypothetical protein
MATILPADVPFFYRFPDHGGEGWSFYEFA